MTRGNNATYSDNSSIKIKPFIILILNFNICLHQINASSFLNLNGELQ